MTPPPPLRVGIMGMGYVGLPLALTFAPHLSVLGFDVDESRIAELEAGHSPFRHIPDERLKSVRLTLTTQAARLRTCDAVLICVPTPLGPHREPDMEYVRRACQLLEPNLASGALVILESTTYPGTTEELVRPLLEAGGKVCGRDFLLAYSPEREDPGNRTHSTTTTPKVVGGVDAASRDRACRLYELAGIRTVPVSCTRTAETSKLLENIFRCVNIALVNEMKMLCHAMDIDVWEVIEAASTKPFGYMRFEPGPGLGGHCIPVDPFYLTWKAREYGQTTRFIELAGEVNGKMPEYVVQRLVETMSWQSKSLRGARILVVGVAYKAGVTDLRESPALEILRRLHRMSAVVEYHDPLVPELVEQRSLELTAGNLKGIDAAIVVTPQPGVDWQALRAVPLILDTRNVPELRGFPNVVDA